MCPAAAIDKQKVDESALGACLKRAMKRIVFPSFSGDAFEVDFGTGYDCFDPLANVENPRIGVEQRTKRLMLRALMEKHGFKHYPPEWWHFTLRDEPYPETWFDFEIE